MKKLVLVLMVLFCAISAQAYTGILELNVCNSENYRAFEYVNHVMQAYPDRDAKFTILNPDALLIDCRIAGGDDRLFLQIESIYNPYPREFETDEGNE